MIVEPTDGFTEGHYSQRANRQEGNIKTPMEKESVENVVNKGILFIHDVIPICLEKF